jgi:hypothetical protein
MTPMADTGPGQFTRLSGFKFRLDYTDSPAEEDCISLFL